MNLHAAAIAETNVNALAKAANLVKCSRSSARNAARKLRYRSSRKTNALFIAASASANIVLRGEHVSDKVYIDKKN